MKSISSQLKLSDRKKADKTVMYIIVMQNDIWGGALQTGLVAVSLCRDSIVCQQLLFYVPHGRCRNAWSVISLLCI